MCTRKINILFFGRVCVSKCHRGSKAEYTCRLVVTLFISGRLIDLVALGKLFRDDLLHLYWIKIEYFHISLFLERLNVSLSKGTHVVSSFVTLFNSRTKIFLDHLSLIDPSAKFISRQLTSTHTLILHIRTKTFSETIFHFQSKIYRGESCSKSILNHSSY